MQVDMTAWVSSFFISDMDDRGTHPRIALQLPVGKR